MFGNGILNPNPNLNPLFMRKVVFRPRIMCDGFEWKRRFKDDRCSSNFKSPAKNTLQIENDKELSPIKVKHMSNKYPRIVQGERLGQDVLTFLSNAGKRRDYLVRNNGDRVGIDTLAGKHLLICCFKVPFPRESSATYACRSLISAYSQLVKDNENNFEMVMVAARMVEEEEAVFNRFFGAFPPCLAIPFWDTESRDFVCRSLCLTHPDKHFAALVLDPDQMVLQTGDTRFYEYGASGFPYSDDRLNAIRREEEEIRCRLDYFHRYSYYDSKPVACEPWPGVSLVELFGGSDIILSRVGGDKICVSELSKKKCVVLYFYVDGRCMSFMERDRQRCVDRNLEFEVVLVHAPFFRDTTSYLKAVQAALEENKLSSWWVMPVSNDWEANHRLGRLCSVVSFGHPPYIDEWMYVADGGNSGELFGRELRESFAVQRKSKVELYPYSRKIILDEVFRRIRSITLDSLLGYDNKLLSSELKGKNVLLYLDYYDGIAVGRYHYKQLVWLYRNVMKKGHPNSQVVFVPLDENKVPQHTQCPPIPCLVPPHPAAVTQGSVITELFPDNQKCPTLIAFGDDGRVRSISAGEQEDLFADTLFQEIFDALRDYCLDDF